MSALFICLLVSCPSPFPCGNVSAWIDQLILCKDCSWHAMPIKEAMEDTYKYIHMWINMYKHIYVCIEREHKHMQNSFTAYSFLLSLKDLLPPAHSCLSSYYDKNGEGIFFHPSCFVKGERNIFAHVPSLCLPRFTLQWIFIAGDYKIQKENWGCITEAYNGKLRFTNTLGHHYWAKIWYIQI